MQYRYDYSEQGREAFRAGKPRSSCPTRLELPATYVLFQVEDARNAWCAGYDAAHDAQARATGAQASEPA